jgi:hypothetical protein
MDDLQPTVTEEEAVQEFLNEHNTLSVELAEFETLEEAESFYQRLREDPTVWDHEAEQDKAKAPEEQSFRRPGFVALEFLMDMWKLPQAAVYDMIEMEVGSIYHPVPIYRGVGVFKILEIRRANEAEFPTYRESYHEQLRAKKRYEGFWNWKAALRREANIKVMAKPPADIFPHPSE